MRVGLGLQAVSWRQGGRCSGLLLAAGRPISRLFLGNRPADLQAVPWQPADLQASFGNV